MKQGREPGNPGKLPLLILAMEKYVLAEKRLSRSEAGEMVKIASPGLVKGARHDADKQKARHRRGDRP